MDMKAKLAMVGAIISFTVAAYFKDIDKYKRKSVEYCIVNESIKEKSRPGGLLIKSDIFLCMNQGI